MSVVLSQRQVNRFQYARMLSVTLETHHATILSSLERAGVSATGLISQLRALNAQVTQQAEAVQEALSAVASEVSEDDSVRQELEAAHDALFKAARFVRERLLGVMGQDAARRYGADAPLPESRDQLIAWARQATVLFKTHPAEAQDPLGFTLTTQALHDLLSPPYTQMVEVMRRYDVDRRETIEARRLRDEHEEQFQRFLTNTALILEGYLRLARLDYHADRIRPTTARVRGEQPVEP